MPPSYREAFSAQKWKSIFVGHFFPPGSESGFGSRDPMNPDPQHWNKCWGPIGSGSRSGTVKAKPEE